MKAVQKGFTLIELMIVIAIIGILAAIAIPQYQDYVIRSKLGSSIASASAIKTAIGVYYQEQGGYPAADDWTGLGLPAAPGASEYVSAVNTTAAGEIVLTLQNIKSASIDGTTLTLTPAVDAGNTKMTWSCAGSSAEAVVTNFCSKYKS
jgi:type IV pilus assembly protein PilA